MFKILKYIGPFFVSCVLMYSTVYIDMEENVFMCIAFAAMVIYAIGTAQLFLLFKRKGI